MTAEDFEQWLAMMYAKTGIQSNRYIVVELLGAGRNQPTRWKKNGAPKYIGLACAALAKGLDEWTTKKEKK